MAGFGGRPKGSGNILSYECKHSIMSVYEALGGAEEMLAWAKKNKDKYYDILVRVLPKDIDMKIQEKPVANVFPINDGTQLPPPPKAVDSIH